MLSQKITKIQVHSGEIKVAKGPEMLVATLGPCIGIAFSWPSKNVCGLAHYQLPEGPGNLSVVSAKQVNQAVMTLQRLMKIGFEDASQVEVYLTGGENMLAEFANNNAYLAGLQNIEAAKKGLKRAGFQIKHNEVGGLESRQIKMNCSTGEVEIKRITQHSTKKPDSTPFLFTYFR